jgi:hypothetical protein
VVLVHVVQAVYVRTQRPPDLPSVRLAQAF